MLFVDNENITDPRINLALEEYLLRHVQVSEPILLFYINEPAIIIGRNQNTIEEIDPAYVKAEGIHVVRRLSGGGAVFHDLGNLNFSFVTPGREDLHNFARFTEPVIKVLADLGLTAELRGRSDIFAEGKKISGNAQYAAGGRMFSHGTLLFETDIETMLKALNPKQVAIQSKAVQSVRNFVTNIRELLPEEITIHDLKEALLRGIFGPGEIPTYELTADDWAEIQRLSAERYQTWEWNFGRSPKFNVQKSGDFPGGKLDIRIDVEKGLVQGIKIYGSFSGRRDVADLEARLIGARYDGEALTEAVAGVSTADYIEGLETAAFLELLY